MDKTLEFDALIVGPGIGKHEQTQKAIIELVKNSNNIVLDADAIFDFNFKHSNILLTPHKGEMKRLTDSSKHEDLSEYSNLILSFIFSKSQLFSFFLTCNLIGVSCGHDFFLLMQNTTLGEPFRYLEYVHKVNRKFF